MIGNLLLSAATSSNSNQRNQSQEILRNQLTLRPQPVINELFNLICSQDRTEHILANAYLKKVIRESQNQRLIDMNFQMQKAFLLWYQRNLDRNSLQEVFAFQRQNIIQLNALYLSLKTSARNRQSFIDVVPFKICELFTKSDKRQLYFYLTFYGQVLRQLVKYRLGNIHSKRTAMGSVMLLKVTTRLNPQNSLQASLWVDFTVNFSKFNTWTPDKNFLINCLLKYQLTKPSLMTLLQFLSTNFKVAWSLEDYCKILQGLQKIMSHCSHNVSAYQCRQVETILKCLKSFLYNFFVSQKKISNPGQALIVEYIHSYQQFEKTAEFMIGMIEHFSVNNEDQAMGNLSQMIVEYSTQILRLYLSYVEQDRVEQYARRFMDNFSKTPQYQRIFIFLSALPKFALQLFGYQQGVMQILNNNIQLSQKYQPVYVNFLTHFITVNQYLQIDVVTQLALFFFNLVESRQSEISKVDTLSMEDLPQSVIRSIQRMSLSVYALSKLSKYEDFVNSSPEYFTIVNAKIFQLLLKSSNDISVLIDSIHELIRRQDSFWNHIIYRTSLQYLKYIKENSTKEQRVILYQLEIELYRIINKTLSLTYSFGQLQSHIEQQSLIDPHSLEQWTELKLLISASSLDQRSQAVKEEILSLFEQILIEFNRITYHRKFHNIQPLLIQFSDNLITKELFEQIYKVLAQTCYVPTEGIAQNNLFEKLEISNQEYAIVNEGPTKELHLTCVKILLQLSLYEKYLQPIFLIVSKLNSRYLLCVWQAIEILYPGKVDQSLIPTNVKERLEKIRTGNILDLFEQMDINEETKLKMKQTPSWYQLYRNILREDSVVIDIIHEKFKEHH